MSITANWKSKAPTSTPTGLGGFIEEATRFTTLVLLTASVALPMLLVSAEKESRELGGSIQENQNSQGKDANSKYSSFSPHFKNLPVDRETGSFFLSDRTLSLVNRYSWIQYAEEMFSKIDRMSSSEFKNSLEKARKDAQSYELSKEDLDWVNKNPVTEKELKLRTTLETFFRKISLQELQLHYEYFSQRGIDNGKHQKTPRKGNLVQTVQTVANKVILHELELTIASRGSAPVAPSIAKSMLEKALKTQQVRDEWSTFVEGEAFTVIQMSPEERNNALEKFRNTEKLFRFKEGQSQTSSLLSVNEMTVRYLLERIFEELPLGELQLHKEYFTLKQKEIDKDASLYGKDVYSSRRMATEWILSELMDAILRKTLSKKKFHVIQG